MPIQIDMMPLGPLQTNCYLIGDTDKKEGLIIDPSGQADVILAKVKERGYTIKEIIATHAHFDHILAGKAVKEGLKVPFRLHKDEIQQLQQMQSLARMFGIPAPEPATHDGLIAHGEIIEVAGLQLEARYTPGHSPGHLIFMVKNPRRKEEKIVFCGDCVFEGSVGRTDLPGGNARRLAQSIKEEILTLDDEMVLCPGHGGITTVGQERRSNPMIDYLIKALAQTDANS